MIPKDVSLEELQRYFARDRFATETVGCRLVEAEYGRAVCTLEVEERHLNANDTVMGGALFTLADFALAVACNIGEEKTVSIDSSISFMRASSSGRLTATCTLEKPGRHVAFYRIEIEDDLGKRIAVMTATCYR